MRRDPERRSPGSECPPAICLLRNHKAPAHGCPLKETGGKSLQKHAKKRALKREEVSYAAPGSLQMGSTCPQLPQPGGAGCHQPCSSRIWLAVIPPHCHVSVSRCSPGALQGAIPQLAHLCYLLQIPHKLCAEPKCPAMRPEERPAGLTTTPGHGEDLENAASSLWMTQNPMDRPPGHTPNTSGPLHSLMCSRAHSHHIYTPFTLNPIKVFPLRWLLQKGLRLRSEATQRDEGTSTFHLAPGAASYTPTVQTGWLVPSRPCSHGLPMIFPLPLTMSILIYHLNLPAAIPLADEKLI